MLTVGWIDEHGDTGSPRQHFAQQLEPLCRQLRTLKIDARQVAARPREAGDKTVLDRVVRHAEHDGDRRRCTLGRECCGEACGCDDHRDLPANQLGRKFGESFRLLCPAIVDRYVLALDIAGFFEALAKSAQPLGNRFGRSDLEKSDYRHRRLLRPRRQRPRRRPRRTAR